MQQGAFNEKISIIHISGNMLEEQTILNLFNNYAVDERVYSSIFVRESNFINLSKS